MGASQSESGFSIVESLVSIAILSVMIVTGFAFTTYSYVSLTADSLHAGASQVVVSAAENMRGKEFDGLVAYCVANSLFSSSSNLQCATTGAQALTFSGDSSTYPIGVPLDGGGNLQVSGRYCVDVLGCKYMADGQLLQVDFAVSWIDINGLATTLPHIMRVHR